jgi:hypothetical protein
MSFAALLVQNQQSGTGFELLTRDGQTMQVQAGAETGESVAAVSSSSTTLSATGFIAVAQETVTIPEDAVVLVIAQMWATSSAAAAATVTMEIEVATTVEDTAEASMLDESNVVITRFVLLTGLAAGTYIFAANAKLSTTPAQAVSVPTGGASIAVLFLPA